MVDLTCEAVEDTAHAASVSGTCHVELDKLPNLNDTKEQKSQKASCRIRFYQVPGMFYSNQMSNACLVIHFSTHQMQTKSDEENIGGSRLLVFDINNITYEVVFVLSFCRAFLIAFAFRVYLHGQLKRNTRY